MQIFVTENTLPNAMSTALLLLSLRIVAGCSEAATSAAPEPTLAPSAEVESASTPNSTTIISSTTTSHAGVTPSALERTGISILADGVVQPVQPPLSLAYETGGKVEALHVQIGDQVQSGDIIARLDGTSAQAQMEQALLNLYRDTLILDDLTRGADKSALAAAQANLASARASLTTLTKPPSDEKVVAARQSLQSAEEALQDLLDKPNPDQIQVAEANLAAAEVQVQRAQTAFDRVKWRPDVGLTQEAANLQDATVQYERAQGEYNMAMRGATDSEIANATAQIAQAQAELDTLQDGPVDDEIVAAMAQVEQAQAALDELLDGASAKDLGTAEVNVELARLSVENAQRDLDNVDLRAPATGTVTDILVAPGAQVGSGVPVATLLNTTQLEIHTTNLSERDLAEILPGQTAMVTLKTYPNNAIEARVVRLGVQAGAEVVGDAATFPVVLILSDTDLDIRPGMTGRVEIRSHN